MNAIASDVHLLIPGLWAPQGHWLRAAMSVPQVPALETLVGCGVEQTLAAGGYEGLLFILFGMAQYAHAPPVAPITRLADGGEPNAGWCARADPVHLTPDRDGLVMSLQDDLSLSAMQASAFVQDINAAFGDRGWHLEALAPQRWYLHMARTPAITTHALSEVMGRPVRPYLPAGAEAPLWHAWMNEVQMVLHAAQANVTRMSHGEVPINSLWFWGGGVLPHAVPAPWQCVWSDDVVARGLSRWGSVRCVPVPADAPSWLAHIPVGRALVVLSALPACAGPEDVGAWAAGVEALEAQWFAPLLGALRRGTLRSLHLYGADGRVFTTSRGDVWRLWRRRRTLPRILDADPLNRV